MFKKRAFFLLLSAFLCVNPAAINANVSSNSIESSNLLQQNGLAALKNAGRLMKPAENSSFVLTPDSFSVACRHDDGQNLVFNFSLLAYKNQGKQVKYWGDALENGLIYENCSFNENNESNIILAIFKKEPGENGAEQFLCQSRLRLIRRENNGNDFFDLNAQIKCDELNGLNADDIIIRIYKDGYDVNNVHNNLLAAYSKNLSFQCAKQNEQIPSLSFNGAGGYPDTRARSSYLQNANSLSSCDSDSLAIVYRDDGSGKLVCDCNLLTCKSSNDQAVYNKCNVDKNGLSNIVLAIFEENSSPGHGDAFIQKSQFKLVRKGKSSDGTEFFELKVELNSNLVKILKSKNICMKIYVNDFDVNNVDNNFLAVFCGGIYDPYFNI